MRNAFVRYTGGASSRAGFQYVGMCKQGAPNDGGTATSNPPRDINFQYNINQGFALEFGDQYMRVKYRGAYVTEAAKNVTGITQANPGVITITAHGFSNNDWVFAADIEGMTEFNNLTWIVKDATTDTFTLTDLFGTAIDTRNFPAWTSAGTFARIYTAVSPYAAVDLPYLKFTQNANTMNLVCWNQTTQTEYPPYNLVRVTNSNWTFTAVSFASAISPPNTVSVSGTSSTTLSTWYSYVVTSIDANGNESIASRNADVQNNDISINAGSNTIIWSHVTGSVSNNIYAATPIYNTGGNPGFTGVQYGYLGSSGARISSGGQQFIDTNIIPDFTRTPPLHLNPFARGAITDIVPTAGGASYTQSGITYTITTSTGSGFVGSPIVQNHQLVGFLINDEGQNYALVDTISFKQGATATMTSATASLVIGALTGTYPGTVQYFQQRLVYANTINRPDTFFMSQPGLYSNFDASTPSIDSDSITGAPWGVQINGIQFMLPSIQGLLTFTGNGVWLVNGGNSVAITPGDENAQAQAQIGCSALVPPLYINLHILYVQAKNSIVRDIAFNFLYNVFQGTDITVFSNHLFSGYTLLQWAYAEEPFKAVWAVRNDGKLLSLTYIKEQEVEGWSRHDTNGQFVGVCSVIEPPVDAIYVITYRYIVGETVWAYYSERMDNRQWDTVEDCFCVDAGLSYSMVFPDATLSYVSSNYVNGISDTNIITGGSGYSGIITAAAFDSTGFGENADFVCSETNGVVDSVTPSSQGQNYTEGATSIVITNLNGNGSGAIVQPIITTSANFSTSDDVSDQINVGDVIRVDGGQLVVTAISGTSIVANITQPLTTTVPNDPNELPVPAVSGTWSVATPTSTVNGLNHLEGMEVTGTADGGVIVPQTVVDGAITLPQAASAITVGLGFIAQWQSLYLDVPGRTTSTGKRANIQAVTLRVEQTRGLQVGTNMPDASTQPNQADIPWTRMTEIKDRDMLVNAGVAVQLFTGDTLPIPVPGEWSQKKQVAIQQVNPLPFTLLACAPQLTMGDNDG